MADHRTRVMSLELFYHLNDTKIAACLRRRENGHLDGQLNGGSRVQLASSQECRTLPTCNMASGV